MSTLATEPSAAEPARRPWWHTHWPEALILLLALVLRATLLGVKPPHFDEGVNGWFVDDMQQRGYFRYDPANFHGPLHFYVLFWAETLFGRGIETFRWVVVLVSMAATGMMLAFTRFLGRGVCLVAALAMAVSPAMVFYGRYAIHEVWMLLFLQVLAWGLLGLFLQGGRQYIWAVCAGAAGCILTKEVYIIHFVAAGLAFGTLWLVERILGPKPAPRPPLPAAAEWRLPAGLSVAAIIFLYSGLFLEPEMLAGLITTFTKWVATGTAEDGGHVKPWYHWFELMARYEWPALVGIASTLWLTLFSPFRQNRALRWLLIWGSGTLVAYSIVRYKTPWCILVLLWPFYFALGAVVQECAQRLDKWLAGLLAGGLLLVSLHATVQLNFRHYADPTEPYVYVQTLPQIRKLTGPLERLVQESPLHYYLRGYVLYEPGDTHPLPWMLAKFPNVRYLAENEAQERMDADFLLVHDAFVADVEDRLHDAYFRNEILLRGNSGTHGMVYLRVATFGHLFPGRAAEIPGDSASEPTPRSDAAPTATPRPTGTEVEE